MQVQVQHNPCGHSCTMHYHINPQCNGKVERLNRTLKEMLMKLINSNRGDWEEQLGVALMAYNDATSSVTGHTPFFLHYGR